MLSEKEGQRAVRLAREALERAYGLSPNSPPLEGEGDVGPFSERRGVFVTLREYPSRELRGCIGFPRPILPLVSAIADAAVAAARDDPRFPPVSRAEVERLVIEVSALTLPEPVATGRPEETVRAIEVGRDGLIVEGYGTSGLLLPQVAPEQGWDAEQLLDGTCEKAGLPPDAWKDPRVRVRRFEAEVFAEASPGGPVVRESPTPPRR